MSRVLTGLAVISLFSLIGAFLFFKVYESLWFFLIVPFLSFLPIIIIIFFRNRRTSNIELFLGHYLFYLNYILLGSFFILLLFLILKFFSIDIFIEINKKRYLFEIITIALLGGIAVYGNRNFEGIEIKNYNISTIKDSKNIPLKFAFISDVHLNGNFDGKKLRTVFQKIEKENIDLVLIGGDFIDNNHKSIKDDIKSIIDKTNFKHGIYLVLGNHEYYGGIDENIKYIKNLGIKVLRDEKIEIEGVTIIGRDDRHNKKRKSLQDLLVDIDSEKPLIVVDHTPTTSHEIGDKKIDLYLSGHTHNGQIFPFNLVVKHIYENPVGFKRIGDANTYVSSGLGTWLIPYRIGSRSEIFIFDSTI